jgi:lipid A 3-O-deacylase
LKGAVFGAALAATLATTGALAGDGARWYLQIDNDVVFVTDRWYTSGVRLGRVAQYGEGELELGFLHEVYTPEQRNWEPGRADRAPTARVLLYVAHHLRDADSFRTVELDLGVQGPAAAGRQTTEFVHRAIPAEDVDWSRQLEPNRFDASVIAARSSAWGPVRLHYGVVAGTRLMFAHAGFEVRYGPGSRDIDFQVMRFAATPPFPAEGGDFGWSVFAGASARAVAFNEMIGPNYDPGGEDIHVRHGIGRLAGGVAYTYPSGSLTFSIVRDTREFDEQRKPQDFGSLAVHWYF